MNCAIYKKKQALFYFRRHCLSHNLFSSLNFLNFTVFSYFYLWECSFFLSITHFLLFPINISWKLGRCCGQPELGRDAGFMLAGPDFNRAVFILCYVKKMVHSLTVKLTWEGDESGHPVLKNREGIIFQLPLLYD